MVGLLFLVFRYEALQAVGSSYLKMRQMEDVEQRLCFVSYATFVHDELYLWNFPKCDLNFK
jgi:hypothetical protein